MTLLVEFFRVAAPVSSVIMFFSPLPTVRAIFKTKSTGVMPFVPLISMVCNAHIWMLYGWMAGKYVEIFATFAFGMAISIAYTAVYYRYTTDRAYANKWIAFFAVVIAVNSLYTILGANGYTNQSYQGVRLTVGYIGDVSSVVMYTSPFEKIPLVLKHRCGVFIPIQIVAVGCINSLTWVVFSLLEIDWQIFAPNTILLVVGIIQIIIYYIYNPATHPLQMDPNIDSPEGKDLESGASDATFHSLSPIEDDSTDSKATDVHKPLH